MSLQNKLNLNFYSGHDAYSDGEIEQELLQIVSNNDSFDTVLAQDSRWPILYHLSPIRHNILNWYPFKKQASLLEIGGGCGALTGALCEKVDKVTVIELSKLRSEINLQRNQHYSNLEIIVGNLNDIKLEEQFDYITLIGVLEYAGSFTDTVQPYQDFLSNIKPLLKKQGKLFIAIENKFGLKYFAGAKEDHTSKFFDGIVGYPDTKHVCTFGKTELQNLLTESGFSRHTFYYPHPDYKMPLEIYSEAHLPAIDSYLSPAPNFDYERLSLFDEAVAYQQIIQNGQYEFFANSFLVECEF